MTVRIVNARRERAHRPGGPARYEADLTVDGETIGTVTRGWTQGGAYNDQYVARVDGVIVAAGRTLADLRIDLAEWNDGDDR